MCGVKPTAVSEERDALAPDRTMLGRARAFRR